MSDKLRSWASTGDYIEGNYFEEEEGQRVPDGAWQTRRAAWLEGGVGVALVPVGILVGGLLALAVIARLLALPFLPDRVSRQGQE